MDNLRLLPVVGQNAESAMKVFQVFDVAILADGAIPKKHNKLIAVAVALIRQCLYCLESHQDHVIAASVSQEELAEVTIIAAVLRAGAAVVRGTHLMNS